MKAMQQMTAKTVTPMKEATPMMMPNDGDTDENADESDVDDDDDDENGDDAAMVTLVMMVTMLMMMIRQETCFSKKL